MTPARSARATHSSVYSWYIVFLCMVAYVFFFIDRQIISLLVGPIRANRSMGGHALKTAHHRGRLIRIEP